MPEELAFVGRGTTGLAKNIVGSMLSRDMAMRTGDLNWIAKTFDETEPNNTREQADDLGQLSPDQPIHISGHVNGSSDPYDYFEYIAAEPGSILVEMYKDVPPDSLYSDEKIYQEVFTAEQANEPFEFYAWATGNADFDYDTYISYGLFV